MVGVHQNMVAPAPSLPSAHTRPSSAPCPASDLRHSELLLQGLQVPPQLRSLVIGRHARALLALYRNGQILHQPAFAVKLLCVGMEGGGD
jgi:hypothetical protein